MVLGIPLITLLYQTPVPLNGYHAGGLAIEQIYGYTVRNAKLQNLEVIVKLVENYARNRVLN